MDTIAKLFLLFILPAGCVPAVLSAPMGPMAYYFLASVFALAGFLSGRREAALFKAEEAGQARQELIELETEARALAGMPVGWRSMFYNGEDRRALQMMTPLQGVWEDEWEMSCDLHRAIGEARWEEHRRSEAQRAEREEASERLLEAEAKGEKWGPFGKDHLRWVAMSAQCPIRRKAALAAIHGGTSPLEFAGVKGFTLAR